MGKRLKELSEETPVLDLTPMIDVTFQLIIFFMCAIKFKTLEGKLSAYLPKDVGVNTSPAVEVIKTEIVIEVVDEGVKVFPDLHAQEGQPWDGTGRFEFREGTRRVRYKVGPQVYDTLPKLQSRLVELYTADPERKATIDAKNGTVYGDIVPVLDVAIEAKYKEITFLGAPPKPKSKPKG